MASAPGSWSVGGSASSSAPAITSRTKSWSTWLEDRVPRLQAKAFDVFDGLFGAYSFPTEFGPLMVREERTLDHPGGAWTRARGTATGQEYDICRLRAGSGAGGFVALEDLEALEREAELAAEAGRHPHPHLLRCHARIIENVGGLHFKVLLYDACHDDLEALVSARARDGGGSVLPAEEVTDLGEQLAQGLGHLHRLGILHGGPTPRCVVRGRDGLWKLTASGRTARFPAAAADWRRVVISQGKAARSERKDEVPPEARGAAEVQADAELVPETDVWLLARMLADVLVAPGSVATAEGDATIIAASPEDLASSLFANLWFLLHWLLAARPADRPAANEVAAMLSAASFGLEPLDLLEGMPPLARESCERAAVAAARQLAVDKVANQATTVRVDVGHLANLSLEELRDALAGSPAAAAVDNLCANCGIDAGVAPPLRLPVVARGAGHVGDCGKGQGAAGESECEAPPLVAAPPPVLVDASAACVASVASAPASGAAQPSLLTLTAADLLA